jgi:hypothetical protein
MANELTFNASLAIADTEGTIFSAKQIINFLQSVATKKYIRDKMNVTVAPLAVPLGSITSLGYGFYVNLDPVNTITLLQASAGKTMGVLQAGQGFWLGFHGTDQQAPFAFATGAACQMDYTICSQ